MLDLVKEVTNYSIMETLSCQIFQLMTKIYGIHLPIHKILEV